MKVVYVPLTIPALYRVLFAVGAMLAATVCVWTVTLTNSPVYKQRVDVELRGHTSAAPTAGGTPSPGVGAGANYSTTPTPALLFQSAASSRYVATTTFVSYDGVVRVECISTQGPDDPTPTSSPLTTAPAPQASADEENSAAQNSTAAPLLLGPFCTVETATHKQLWFAGLVAAAAPGVAGIVALIAVFVDDRTLGPTGSVAAGLAAVAIWVAHHAVQSADMRGVADRVLARYGGAGSLRVFDEQYTGYLVVRWVVLVVYASCALVGFTACCTKVQRPLVLRATRNRGAGSGNDHDERSGGVISATDDAEMMDATGVSYDMSSRTLRPAALPQLSSGRRPIGAPDAAAATQRPAYTLSVPRIRLLGTESHTAAAVAVAHSAAGPEDDDDAALQFSPRQSPPPHQQRLTSGDPRAAEPVVDYNVADDGSSASAAAAPPTPPPA